jgi:hypothetical protein
MISYKKRKTDKWPQLMTRAQMIEVWEKIQMHPDEELPQQPIESDENIASTTLLALVGPPSRQRDWSTERHAEALSRVRQHFLEYQSQYHRPVGPIQHVGRSTKVSPANQRSDYYSKSHTTIGWSTSQWLRR